MPIHPTIPSILIALLSIALGSPIARSANLDVNITAVTLKSTVRLTPEHTNLTINDIATVSGPQTTAIRALPILADNPIVAGQWTTIDASTIRTLIEQSSGIQSGSLVITGPDIAITRRASPKPGSSGTPSDPVARSNPPTTLRDQLEQWVYTLPWLKSTPESTRITFPDTARDRQLLSTPTRGRTVIFNEIGRSKLISVGVVIYEGDRLVTETTIRFNVQIQRPVLVSNARIARAETITAEKTVLETRWLSPMEPIADPASAIGQASKKHLNPGTVLLAQMIEYPILIKRGSIVSARSLAGRVSITMSVRALSNGRLGEVVELESRDHTQQFTARVAGPGRVVILKDKPIEPHDD